MTKAAKSQDGDTVKTQKAAKSQDGDTDAPAHYEEWRVEKKFTTLDDEKVKVTFDKLKKLRPVVKISEEEAAALNAGITSMQSAGLLIMYLKTDQDIEEFSFVHKPKKG